MPLPAHRCRLVQAPVKTVMTPDLSLRGARRRGNLSRGLPRWTGHRRTCVLTDLTVAALPERHVRDNSTAGGRWCTTEPPDVSLRGGRRPTWRPEREARGSALGVQSRSTRPECGKAIGEIAAAFPRLPRPLRGLAMTSREPLLFYRQPAPVAGAEPGPAVHSPAMADGEKNSPSGAW